MSAVSHKQQAHELIERLEDSQIETAIRFLEFMLMDPVARAAATARPDDEPVTEDDHQRLQSGGLWLAQRRGKGIPMSDVLADFGFKAEDFPL